ncbi:MAG: ribokinase [Roseovarius sp.]
MILNLGSINADHFYELPRLVGPGETLAASAYSVGLGGKGANQSVAAAQAGAKVRHIGAVGPEGGWLVEKLARYGVDTRFIRTIETPTAHAIVMIDREGENQIVIYPGSNAEQNLEVINVALEEASPGDWLMLQNETSHVPEAAKAARERGLHVAYSAAPFDAEAARAVLPHVSLLFLNAVEARQLAEDLGIAVADLPVPCVLVTKGAEGAELLSRESAKTVSVQAKEVQVVDTTGAGDTLAGYMVAGLSMGLSPEHALERASAAASLSVTKKGTADAIPSASEVDRFLA